MTRSDPLTKWTYEPMHTPHAVPVYVVEAEERGLLRGLVLAFSIATLTLWFVFGVLVQGAGR